MYMGKKILAVIPARGGSKGIKDKNIVKVEGIPLINYTIKEALKSKFIDKLVVSTDSERIADIAMKGGAEVPFLRSKSLAKDETKTIEVLIDVVKQLELQGDKYDYLILLQPTQPLRRVFHIEESIQTMVEKKLSSLVSINEVNENPILFRTINSEKKLETLLDINSSLRRQEYPTYFKVNGAIYINKLDENFTVETSLNDNEYPYIMDKQYDLDIDEPIDLEILKLKLKELK